MVSSAAEDSLARSQIREVVTQLVGYVRELRQLGGVRDEVTAWPCGLPYSGLYDPPPAHPIRSLADFYQYWVDRWEYQEIYPGKWPSTGKDKIDGNLSAVLSHGNLEIGKIVVRGTHIVAILDWSHLGWYPDFWEALMARQYRASQDPERKWTTEVMEAFGVTGEVADGFYALVCSAR